MSKLLLDESPLVIQPSLASKIGLNESIFIQQVHYWLKRSQNNINGRLWTYNTHTELQEQFPFWSLSTIKRTIKSLKDAGILLVEQLSNDTRNKTNWYSLDYDVLEKLTSDENLENPENTGELTMSSKRADASGQNDPMHEVNMNSCIKNKSLTKTSTKTSTKKKNNNKKDFSFSISRASQYDNLTDEYQAKLKAYAVTKDGAYQLNKFLDYNIAKGTKYKDWSRAYNTWLSNSREYSKGKYDPSDYLQKLPHPTLENVFAEYGVNNAYDADTLTCIGEYSKTVTAETQQPQQIVQDASRTNKLMASLARGVKL